MANPTRIHPSAGTIGRRALGMGAPAGVLLRLNISAMPQLLGFVLGSLPEENFRRALVLPQGEFTIVISRPLSVGLYVVVLFLVLVGSVVLAGRRR